MSIQIELTSEQISDIVREDLMEAYEMNARENHDEGGAVLEPDSEFLYCLQQVIEYYSSPAQYEAWQRSLGIYEVRP